jgi:hypothetical protein
MVFFAFRKFERSAKHIFIFIVEQSRLNKQIRKLVNGQLGKRRRIGYGVEDPAKGMRSRLAIRFSAYFFWCDSSKWCEMCL